MTIVLNHTIVPARDKKAAARFFAKIFGLKCEPADYFAPVRVNDQMTLLFDDDTAFDAIFKRVNDAGLAYGSGPEHPDNGKLNNWGGGRGFYFKDPDGHLLELMTVPQ